MNVNVGQYGCQISLTVALQPKHIGEIYNKLHAKCMCTLKGLYINYLINYVDFLNSLDIYNTSNIPSNYFVLTTVI
jgi:hypothetical protein